MFLVVGLDRYFRIENSEKVKPNFDHPCFYNSFKKTHETHVNSSHGQNADAEWLTEFSRLTLAMT